MHGTRVEMRVVTPTMPPDKLASRAVADGCSRLIAAGGDGTVSAVASAVTGSQATLAILPCGTLNHLAKDLKIPLEIDEAIQLALNGNVTTIDVGEVNGRVFVNNSSIGLYPLMVAERDRDRRRGVNRWWAMAKAVASLMKKYPVMHVKLEADVEEKAIASPLVFVGNNRYEMSGMEMGTRERLDGGRLFVYAPAESGRLQFLKIMAGSLIGAPSPELVEFATEQVKLVTRKSRLRVAIDGEVTHLDSPLDYRIRRKALRVVVPGGIQKAE